MTAQLPDLCGTDSCRRLAGHVGYHNPCPTEAWGFFDKKDKKKLNKAGFATPRGGAKGGYQNHVGRSRKVIIPYERLGDLDLALYKDDYVVRLLPEQYFKEPGVPRDEFIGLTPRVVVGKNAFVLYRTHEVFSKYPPLPEWRARSILFNGREVNSRRGNVEDIGHYILRISRIGELLKRNAGPPQGIFATEYADKETNYLCKCVLAWLIIQTVGSPYTLTQAGHLRSILRDERLDDTAVYEHRGVLRHGLCCCPLCMRFIRYPELHETVSFSGEDALENAAARIQGATRSTIVNLFHLKPTCLSCSHSYPE